MAPEAAGHNQRWAFSQRAGLRQLADYLDTRPAIPVAPYGCDLLVSTFRDTDPGTRSSATAVG